MRLQHFFTPEKSTVLSLACSPRGLYAGLVNGSVASYTKAAGTCSPATPGVGSAPPSLGACHLWSQAPVPVPFSRRPWDRWLHAAQHSLLEPPGAPSTLTH